MREKLSRKVLDIKPSGIRKFFDVASEIPDVISLGVGEPDFDTPWHIREEGIKALKNGKSCGRRSAGIRKVKSGSVTILKKKYF